MDADQSPPTETRREPSTTALAILLSITLLAVLLLGWVWYTRYAPVHFDLGPTATITDAEDARYIIPIILGGTVLIATLWLATWLLRHWTITLLPVAIGIIGLVALIFFGIELRQSIHARQPISIVHILCDPHAPHLSRQQAQLPAGCEEMPSDHGATIGTSGQPAIVQGDASGVAHSFRDLPPGAYSALLTAEGQPDTAEMVLAVETSNGVRAIAPLAPGPDATWSGPITLHPDLNTYYLLNYRSPYEPAENARIRITVQECTGTSLANFDASACNPAPLSGPVVEIQPAEPSGRPAVVALDTEGMTLTNLERRAYTLTPEIPGDGLRSGRSDTLVIPTDGPQTSDRNVLTLDPGHPQGAFTVEVGPDAGELSYTIYVFVDSTTVAHRSDVRP